MKYAGISRGYDKYEVSSVNITDGNWNIPKWKKKPIHMDRILYRCVNWNVITAAINSVFAIVFYIGTQISFDKPWQLG